MKVLRVRGRSMEPFLLPGDWVAVRAVAHPGELRPGDLAVLRVQGHPPVIHRFLGMRGGHLLTRGDNRPAADPPWPSGALRGKVVARSHDRHHWSKPAPRAAHWLARLGPPVPRFATAFLQLLLIRSAWIPTMPPMKNPSAAIATEPVHRPLQSAPRWESQRLGSDWAVLDTHTHAIHLLNPMAHAIWRKLVAGLDKQALMAEMQAKYPCTPSQCLDADLENSIGELRKAGLLGESNELYNSQVQREEKHG